MTTFQIYHEEQVINVTFDQNAAHEFFGVGGFIEEVKVTFELNAINEQMKHSEQNLIREAIETCSKVKENFELEKQHVFLCNYSYNVGFEYLDDLDELIVKLAFDYKDALKELNIPYQIEVQLALFSN